MSIFPGKSVIRRCKVQRYWRYEGVGGGPIPRKKALRNTRMAPETLHEEFRRREDGSGRWSKISFETIAEHIHVALTNTTTKTWYIK